MMLQPLERPGKEMVPAENKFKVYWEQIKKQKSPPLCVRQVLSYSFNAFATKVLQQEDSFVQEIVESLYAGDVYILKQVLPSKEILALKRQLFRWGQDTLSSFHKMYDGVPDFHRDIRGKTGQKYAFDSGRHSYYFFPWNGDPFHAFELLRPSWKVIKFLGGFPLDHSEKNLPYDGIIERAHIAHLRHGTGFMEVHTDPLENNKIIFITALSTKGLDYHEGGVFFFDLDNHKVFLDDHLDSGDSYIGCPSLPHGVDTIKVHASKSDYPMQGRWVFLPFMVYSDYVQTKDKSYAVKM